MNRGVALGIDFGTARIGVAACDPMRILASPLETIEVAAGDPLTRIIELVRERGAETVVVGLPLRMDGSEGPAAGKVRGFVEALAARLPAGVGVFTIDERLTTQEAHHLLGKTKKRRNIRETRTIVDQAAAVLILQDYLDNECPTSDPFSDDGSR